MPLDVWHQSDDGDRMRLLGDDSPGRHRDDREQWRPIDRTRPGPSPASFLQDWWATIAAGRRDAYRFIMCSVQG